jgi:hypothetical protein
MSKHLAALAIVVLSSAAAANARQPVPVRTAAPALPALPNASEFTDVSYTASVPAPLVGQLDADDSTYNRVEDGNCSSLSSVGTAVAYDYFRITNNTSSTAHVIVTTSLVGGGACGDANNTFLTSYVTFGPADPRRHCSAANDDIAGAANRCSTLSFDLAHSEERYVVVSSFANPPAGLFSYQVNFTGTTPVELIDVSVESSGGR